MEPTQLQLVLNVVTITGVTSLAGYCYLLKKENRKLTTATDSHSDAPKAETVRQVVQPVKTVDVDIRTFASARRTRWVKGLASSISRRVLLRADLPQHFRLSPQFRLARGKLADAEHVGQNVGILLASELSGAIRRHGGANSLEEIACGETVPVGGELATGERWRGFSAAERASMA